MYCKHCGYQVGPKDTQCRHCGTELEGLEVCGGFWGLLGKEPEAAVIPAVAVQEPAEEPISPETEQQPETPKSRERKPVRQEFPILFRIAIGVCILCIAALIVLFISIRSNAAELERLRSDLAAQRDTVSRLREELDEARQELDEAQQMSQEPEVTTPPVQTAAESEPMEPSQEESAAVTEDGEALIDADPQAVSDTQGENETPPEPSEGEDIPETGAEEITAGSDPETESET